ncbi:uncharacterized protein LOC129778195 [Toxorhynchites rutilus septentrionalis]|uniref:uncharacterized protein LOC129778195 n=1 Tax=Toxorhynchites rutilus septentrionalis TaxID=329112 RepID=UPI00247941EA|nr:uncharacterized protein LOC129778195 [Toxorhynchites rutilus septentrionalis]XP_055640914.1 uncharacterized protein LOC129778195 [Toxorhynchites rutilus septentrionalis]XP_055640915.1 uncharacterized protein LOC129778195 [Toxorhynchites rutilus septentrionalis]
MFLKIILQEVWRLGVQWDEAIPEKQFESWMYWVELLPTLENVRVRRCYRQETSISNSNVIQMHTFVDASENGMAAVVFLRCEENGRIECTLVGAKTRVSPLKYMSIPRLELQAAVIGTRLADSIMENLTIKISERFFWSDSRNVLCWLNSDHRRYSPFVAARVGEILESTDVNAWKWVPTRSNVADDGTKWVRQPDLTPNSRWYRGPDFLRQSRNNWPVMLLKNNSTNEELRPNVLFHQQTTNPVIQATKFSRWQRLVNVTAYVVRFVSNVKLRQSKLPLSVGPLTSLELRRAEEQNLRQAQSDKYMDELLLLTKAKSTRTIASVPKSSSLYKLSPFVDNSDMLRMKGRANACEFLSYETKNPVILPTDHPITNLIVASYHDRFHHRNHATVINEIRQKYHIIRLRATLSKVRKNCQRCKNRDAVPHPPEMAELPFARLAAFTRPFTHVGVDYFGPIEINIGRRVEKRWGVLLTCLTVRAVHIEVAASLSTSSCIIALRNFVLRRGTPRAFYSDRGTNFVGARRT